MTTPFLIKGMGFLQEEVGIANKLIGIWLTILGAFLGGLLMTRLSLYRALLVFGILQAVSPMVAHLAGARRDVDVAEVLRHGLMLALLLAVPGVLFLLNPDPLLALAPMEPAVEAKVRAYLDLLAWGLPATLLYRTFYAFSNALGRARILMLIGVVSLAVHALLAWGLAQQGWLGEPLGVVGCAASNVLISWLTCVTAAGLLHRGPLGQRYRPFAAGWKIRWPVWREMLRLGVPMGVSNFIEITAFTLIALFIAPLGAVTVAGHRILANLSALTYMLPLSLGIATLAAVGHALGRRDRAQAEATIVAGLGVAEVLSVVVAFLLWFGSAPVVALYTDDAEVRKVAVGLLIYIAVYQFFDALQTIAGHVLRAYRVTFVPMLVQMLSFWGIGLGLGWWLCYRGQAAMGLEGFWWAAAASIVLAAMLLGAMLWRVVKSVEY
ncbi:MAG TPA: MATE family efflux transporter [Rhodocyclaceae bacterium]|nr:MATE family efflux transporter [Rhodocyclaceae bacterium]